MYALTYLYTLRLHSSMHMTALRLIPADYTLPVHLFSFVFLIHFFSSTTSPAPSLHILTSSFVRSSVAVSVTISLPTPTVNNFFAFFSPFLLLPVFIDVLKNKIFHDATFTSILTPQTLFFCPINTIKISSQTPKKVNFLILTRSDSNLWPNPSLLKTNRSYQYLRIRTARA